MLGWACSSVGENLPGTHKATVTKVLFNVGDRPARQFGKGTCTMPNHRQEFEL